MITPLPRTPSTAQSKLPLYLLVVYLTTLVLEGPLRFLLAEVGLQSLVYLRDAMMVGFILLALLADERYASRQAQKLLITVAIALLLHSLWGVVHLDSPVQVGFGLKLFVPILFGIACYDSFDQHVGDEWRIFAILFVVSAGGVVVNYFYEMPWAGLRYEVGGVTLRGVKDWYAGSFRRLYGFGRASGTVAVQILIFWIVVVLYLKSMLLKTLSTVLAALAIALTTTKGVLLAFVVVLVYLFLRLTGPAYHGLRKSYVMLFWILGITIPLFFLFADFKTLDVDSSLRLALASFADRGVNTWPRAADLLDSEGVLAIGRGIGGAGTPQLYFELDSYNPGDNLFVYWWLLFGVFAAAYYFMLLAGLISLRTDMDRLPLEAFYVAIALSVLVYSLTTYVFEGGEFACFGGILFAALFRRSFRSYS